MTVDAVMMAEEKGMVAAEGPPPCLAVKPRAAMQGCLAKVPGRYAAMPDPAGFRAVLSAAPPRPLEPVRSCPHKFLGKLQESLRC